MEGLLKKYKCKEQIHIQNLQRFVDLPIGNASPPFYLSCEVGPNPQLNILFRL